MFITVPKSKFLRVVVDGNGLCIQAHDIEDSEAPVKTPAGDPWTCMEYRFVGDFLLILLLVDPAWGADLPALYAGMEIRNAFTKAKPGDVIELTHDQYKRLVDIMRTPRKPYHPPVAIHLKSFFQAIERATETDTRKVDAAQAVS